MALDKLIAEVQHLPLSEDFADWQRGVLAAIPIYLRNQLHYHGWARDADLNDAAEVLGHRPQDLKVADRELVDFVRSAAPEHDKALVRLFYRRLLRHCLILAGPDAATNHLALAKVAPIPNRLCRAKERRSVWKRPRQLAHGWNHGF